MILCLSGVNSAAFERLLFEPPAGAILEPRIGGLYQSGDEKLRLDIGASFDLAEIYNTPETKLRIGADFFTYTRLRSEGRFKFPVETSDYFFGVNASYNQKSGHGRIGARLRISHISSHMVDGYTSEDWEFTQKPIVYSREFFDLLISYRMKVSDVDSRIYGGSMAIFSTIPDDVSTFIPQLGADFEKELLPWLILRGGVDCRIFTAEDISDPSGSQLSLQVGAVVKTSENMGVALNYNWFNGRSIHGMFYNEVDYYNGVGFQLIFY
jgi:hypothetical protein